MSSGLDLGASIPTFVKHFDQIDDVEQAFQSLKDLLRPRDAIRDRYSDAKDSYSNASHLRKLLENDIDSEDYEHAIIRLALTSGHGLIVKKELLLECESQELNRFGRTWMCAIQTRELQLQVLVVCCLSTNPSQATQAK